MELRWFIIAMAAIFIFLLIFFILWAFGGTECTVNVNTLKWDSKDLNRDIAKATIERNDIKDIINRTLRERQQSLNKAPLKVKETINEFCSADLDMYVAMVKAIKDADDDELQRLNREWEGKMSATAEKVSSQINVSKENVMTMFRVQLKECLRDAREVIGDSTKEITIKNPIVHFGKIEDITITSPDPNMVTF